jgi:type IV secretion system protein VirD4
MSHGLTIHGAARFAHCSDLLGADLIPKDFSAREDGLVIGTYGLGFEVRYRGPSHLLTIAPNRTGKGVGVVIPNLLSNPGYPGSIVVTDIKGELAAVTARYRQEVLGHKVYIINPWRDKMRDALGIDLGDSPFNPLASLKADSPSLQADALMFAKMLVPLPAGNIGNEKFFKEEAQSLLKLFMCWLVLTEGSVTLPRLREALLFELEEVLEDLAGSEDPFEDLLRRDLQAEAVSCLNVKGTAPKQFLASYGEAKTALAIYASSDVLGKHLSGHSGLDFGKIKQEPTTVYIVVPSERLTDYRRWFDLVVGSAVKAVSSAPAGGKALFLLDEFGNLGYLPYIRDEISGSPGKGLQFWFIMQEWAQFAATYGEGASTFWNQADIKQVFAIQEEAIVRLIQPRLGTRTEQTVQQQDHLQEYELWSPEVLENAKWIPKHATPKGYRIVPSYTYSTTEVPLIRNYELYQFPRAEQLIFHANLPPIKASKLNYLESEKYKRRADDNPWHSTRRSRLKPKPVEYPVVEVRRKRTYVKRSNAPPRDDPQE